jgi:hypothetical protein
MPKITVKEQSAPQPAASQEEKTVLTDSKGRHITFASWTRWKNHASSSRLVLLTLLTTPT